MKAKFILVSINLSILSLTIISCSKQPPSEIKTINVLESEEAEPGISEIADDIKYIPLANDSLLATIMNVVYSDGEYFVEDNKSKFLRFDETGKLLNQVGRIGEGPGEYRYVSDFIIQPATNEILMTGGKKGQIMVYSPDGQFIRSINLTKQITPSIGISQENILAFYLNGAEHLNENMELLDDNGTVISSYPNKYEFNRGRAMISFISECLMYEFNKRLHFKEIFSDTVFYIEGQEMIPEMILNSDGKGFTPEIRSKIISELSADPGAPSEGMSKSLIQYNLFGTNKYLFYSYGYNSKNMLLIFDKTTNKQIVLNNQTGFINDWDGGPNIQLKMNIDDNTVLSWIDAFELKQYVESDAFKNATPKYPEKKKKLEQQANSLNENDNPVLMLVKLKE